MKTVLMYQLHLDPTDSAKSAADEGGALWVGFSIAKESVTTSGYHRLA